MKTTPLLLGTPFATSIVRFDELEPLDNQLHLHAEAEFIFVEEGKAAIELKRHPYNVSAGNLLLIHAKAEHRIDSSSLKGYSVMLSGLAVAGLPEGCFIAEDESPLVTVKEHYFSFSRYLEDAHRENANEPSSAVAQSLITAVLHKVLQLRHTDQAQQSSSIAEKTKLYIEQNYFIELSLNDLANHIYVSPYHLSHTFKQEIGVAPIQYLIQYRIEMAKKLLQTTDLPISKIALKVGYPNANYFNLIFKKMTGLSPGKYRKSK